jgi:HAE1 family hydrophobic/amphiphilic exporter-1
MPSPPSYQKVNPAEQPIVYLALTSTTLPFYTLDEYTETLLARRSSTLTGVSRVQVYGAQKYAVRVQVDPEKMAAYGVGIDDVQHAIAQGNTNLPAGRVEGANQAFTLNRTDSFWMRRLFVH